MRRISLLLAMLVCAFCAVSAQDITEGTLAAYGKKGAELGACPLKNTTVKAEISGFQSRVRVVQEFENSFSQPIEAVYVFPLPENAAVDDMTMRVGERTVRGKILRREEARQVYETAKTEGKTASLLDQERPNIFTQSVANILPGDKIIIEISYVNTLKYEDGAYEFVFPMTVGPRYIPGSVKDAGNIKPPVAKTRAGHDISIEVNLNAGVPVEEIRSPTHEIQSANFSASAANVKLRNEKTIPNKDFILRYDVSGKKIEDALLTHRDERGGFFTLILQPPDRIAPEDVSPKEIVFVLDTSGSMSGFPIEKAKEAMLLSLDGLYPQDTFNLITFAGDTEILFDAPVPATPANLARAKRFLESRNGAGGTEMMKAIKAALEPTDSQSHVRIVCFMTDGYVGNEAEIISEVQKHPNARVFSFGIGSSVNRFLLEKIAEEGRGEAEFVGLQEEGSKAAKKFYERVRTPLLTDVSVDWNGLPVADVYPKRNPDLFSAKPVVIFGRYKKGASGTIRLKGKIAGQDYVREIPVNFPETQAANDSLATLWARARIDEMTRADYKGEQKEITDAITNIGLEYRLLTQFTSFVAVEERIVTQGGKPVKVEVPVEIPEGVKRETTVGDVSEVVTVNSTQVTVNVTSSSIQSLPVNGRRTQNYALLSAGALGNGKTKKRSGRGSGQGSGMGSGSGGGVGYGRGNGVGDGVGDTDNAFVIDGAEVTNFRSGILNSTNAAQNSDAVYGRAESLPKPKYTAKAKAAKATGEVKIEIEIDEQGKVVSANALSGNSLLREVSIKAASGTKFAPTVIDGRAVKIVGTIIYNFTGTGGEVKISFDKMRPKPLSADEQAKLLLADKFHIWLFAVVERLRNGAAQPGENETKFVRNGKAEIQIRLTEKTPAVLSALKSAGVEITNEKEPKTIVGRIALEKLASLAQVKHVEYVLPNLK